MGQKISTEVVNSPETDRQNRYVHQLTNYYTAKTMITWLKKYAIAVMAPNMRSPSNGIVGWCARRLMRSSNPKSTAFAIRNRLNLKPSDVFVELGAGEGAGIQAVMENHPNVPGTVHLVEISDAMRAELERVVDGISSPPKIEIHREDCRRMSYLEDDSVDKIFGMNVVYFLDPLPEYLEEIRRVLKPGGEIVWGCKFDKVPKDSEVFVNVDEDEIAGIMRDAGFQVTSEMIDVAGDSVVKKEKVDDEQELTDMRNYIELKGRK